MAITQDIHDYDLCLKRKRVFGDNDICFEDTRQQKRSHTTELPIRSSPSPPIHQDRHWQTLAPGFHGPLTPVDSSDDEAHGQAENPWFRKRNKISTQQWANQKTSLVNSVQSCDEEMDMETSNSHTFKQTPSLPQRHINSLPPSAMSFRDRAPTPITATFNIFETSSRNRGKQMTQPTMLSPLMGEESYLPSPVESISMSMNGDSETIMRMEHASSGFGALSVECKDDAMMEDPVMSPTSAKFAKANAGKGARLHMGFRADCEKCQQRVPGHYSHIVWN